MRYQSGDRPIGPTSGLVNLEYPDASVLGSEYSPTFRLRARQNRINVDIIGIRHQPTDVLRCKPVEPILRDPGEVKSRRELLLTQAVRIVVPHSTWPHRSLDWKASPSRIRLRFLHGAVHDLCSTHMFSQEVDGQGIVVIHRIYM